jgi:hypothetical protein
MIINRVFTIAKPEKAPATRVRREKLLSWNYK